MRREQARAVGPAPQTESIRQADPARQEASSEQPLQSLLQLQRKIGNSAFSGLIQRRESAVELAPDVEQMLEDLFPTPDVPTFEAISASTSAESAWDSPADLTGEIGRMWERNQYSFTEAARESAASESLGRGQQTTHPIQSPQSETRQYAAREALAWVVSEYNSWSDLRGVLPLLRQGSPFAAALSSEFSNITRIDNPTSDRMYSTFYDAIFSMHSRLPEGALGELLVYFSGHGGRDGIFGSDEQRPLDPLTLQRLSNMAAEMGIHTIFVIDTCNFGDLVNVAQGALGADLGSRIQALPADQRTRMTTLLNQSRQLGRHLSQLNHRAQQLAAMRRARSEDRPAIRETFVALADQLRLMWSEPAETPEGGRDTSRVRNFIPVVLASALIGAERQTAGRIRIARSDLSPLLSVLSDQISSILVEVRSAVAGAEAPDGAAP